MAHPDHPVRVLEQLYIRAENWLLDEYGEVSSAHLIVATLRRLQERIDELGCAECEGWVELLVRRVEDMVDHDDASLFEDED